jgi:hypothetical protein
MTTTNSDATSTALTTLAAAFDGGSSGEEAIKPVLKENPRLQWFNGLSTTDMNMAVGWHIEAEVNPLLDEVATLLGLKRYVVQHKTTGQNGEAKQLPYWSLNFGQKPASLFVISLGLQSKRQMNKTEDRLGIAYGWEVVRDGQGAVVYKLNSEEPKKQCKLQFRAFVQELYAAGFQEWLQVGIAGYLTDYMLDALNEQFRTLEAYGSHTESEGGTRRNAPFFGFSIPFIPGPVKMVGPQNGEKSAVYPMVAQIPQQIEKSFLTDHMIPRDLLSRLRDGLLDETVMWSVGRSVEINQGTATTEERPEDDVNVVESTVVVEEAPAPASKAAAPSTSARTAAPRQLAAGDDRLVNEEERKWIVNGYCMGTQAYVKTVCQRFGVSTPDQLRLSHYSTLYNEATTAQPAQ